MTSFESRVKRRTVCRYRIAISGAFIDERGKRLVVGLEGDGNGDFVTIREERRRQVVRLDVAELYRRGMRAMAEQDRKARKNGRKG